MDPNQTCDILEKILEIGEDPNPMKINQILEIGEDMLYGPKEASFAVLECIKQCQYVEETKSYTCDAFQLIVKYGYDCDKPLSNNMLNAQYKDSKLTFRQLLTAVIDTHTYDTKKEEYTHFLSLKSFNEKMNKQLAETLLDICNREKLFWVTNGVSKAELAFMGQEVSALQLMKAPGSGCCVIA